MNEWSWIAAAFVLAAINTGGGANVGKGIDADGDFIGRDKILYAEREEWRLIIAQRLEIQSAKIMELERNRTQQWVTIAAMIIMLAFIFTASVGVLARQFDLLRYDMRDNFSRLEQRINQQQWRPTTPTRVP